MQAGEIRLASLEAINPPYQMRVLMIGKIFRTVSSVAGDLRCRTRNRLNM